jgi:hypothetical protein
MREKSCRERPSEDYKYKKPGEMEPYLYTEQAKQLNTSFHWYIEVFYCLYRFGFKKKEKN